MIFRQLYLRNFGVYEGEHWIDLEPSSERKPIILFGGLNGGGKTTIIDAIQLVFFGKLSRCSTRGNLGYEEFLRRSINRDVDPSVGASISLELEHTVDGERHIFVIERAWEIRGKTAVEVLSVSRDGAPDREFSENWLEHVDQFIPIGLAELFFFDGEKIERLADGENSADILKSAIDTLLGIDLVRRLDRDLRKYERDLGKQRVDPSQLKEVERLEQDLSDAQDQLMRLTQERAERQNAVDRAAKQVDQAEVRFRQEGGQAFADRKELEAEKGTLKNRQRHVEEDCRELAAGVLPLRMLANQIEVVRSQSRTEADARKQLLLLGELEARDAEILKRLHKNKISDSARRTLQSLFREDRIERTRTASTMSYLNLGEEGEHVVAAFDRSIFKDIQRRARKLVSTHQGLLERRKIIEDRLQNVPDDAAIEEFTEELRAARSQLISAEAGLESVRERLDSAVRGHGETERKLSKMLEQNADELAQIEEHSRKMTYAKKVRQTVETFRSRILEKNLRKIEDFILESFKKLSRKRDFVHRIIIDPASYSMRLIGRKGEEIGVDRLSAGERQLLALSTLWGLAQASGRTLPNVIDTPLGRLDSEHRTRMVERYLPHASHQVIILSTDEEIDGNYYSMIQRHVSRKFLLDYNDLTGSTAIRPGYFANLHGTTN